MALVWRNVNDQSSMPAQHIHTAEPVAPQVDGHREAIPLVVWQPVPVSVQGNGEEFQPDAQGLKELRIQSNGQPPACHAVEDPRPPFQAASCVPGPLHPGNVALAHVIEDARDVLLQLIVGGVRLLINRAQGGPVLHHLRESVETCASRGCPLHERNVLYAVQKKTW